MPTLYHAILGDSFESLPERLRGFHDQVEGGAAEGIIRVTRGKGWLRERLAGERVMHAIMGIVYGKFLSWRSNLASGGIAV